MARKKTIWRKLEGIELTPTPHSFVRMKSVEDPTASSTANLELEQLERLRSVLTEKVDIHGKGNFPTITTRLIDLINCVRYKLKSANMSPKCVKMNGGAASFVTATKHYDFADLDIIFAMDVDDADSFEKVRDAVFDTIMDLMPGNANKTKINADTLKDVYIRKMVKVSGEDDRWSLFSLHNNFGRCIELKFVDRMRRQFEFSVDSFQITLDPLLDHIEATNIKIESVFGDINQALNHLQEKLIETRRPEEIRGGGLLKYCHLLVRGYTAARPAKCRQDERYMCSRFFIDFPDVSSQEMKLRNYLDNHFGNNSDQWSYSGDDTDSEASTSQAPSSTFFATSQLKYDYLIMLHKVISESTVCLMSHDKKHTLAMVDRLAFQLLLNIHSPQSVSSPSGQYPKTTLYYLNNTSQWIPVV